MQEVADRISQRMGELNIKQADIMRATKAGRATVSSWVNGATKPSSDYLPALAKVLKTDPNWLLTGKDTPAALVSNVEPANLTNMRQIPVLNWVQAGVFTDISENGYDEFISIDFDSSCDTYALRIRGDSMEKEFKEGDLIIVDADRQPVAGNYVIAMVDGADQATFKRYKPCGFDERLNKDYFQLIALNDFYAPIDSRHEVIRIVGVVIEHKRRLI